MDTEELRETLSIVAPSLSTKDFIPAFRDLFFDGKHISGFNGKFGISMGCETGCQGSVRGEVLKNFMEHSRARQTELTVKDLVLTVLSGGSTLELPFSAEVTPPIQALLLNTEAQSAIVLDDQVVEGVDKCLRGTVDDPTLGPRMGILFEVSRKGVDLYSTDSKTISHFSIAQPTSLKQTLRFSVACDFVAQLLRLAGKFTAGASTMSVDAQSVSVTFGPSCVLVGSVRGVEADIIESFSKTIAHHCQSSDSPPMLIPQAMIPALDRALSVAEPQNPLFTRCQVDHDHVYLFTKTRYGEVNDRVKFTAGLPAIEFSVEVSLLRRMLENETTIEFTNSFCIVLRQGNFLHLIGTQPSKTGTPAVKKPGKKVRETATIAL